MSDPLQAYYGEIRAVEDDYFNLYCRERRVLGTSVWQAYPDRLREIDARHGVRPDDPRVYSIAAYLAERQQIDQGWCALRKARNWDQPDLDEGAQRAEWAAQSRYWARLDDCKARHFPGLHDLQPATIDTIPKLWAHITQHLAVVAERIHSMHPAPSGQRPPTCDEDVQRAYTLLHEFKVPWAPPPPYHAFTQQEARDELKRIANQLERDDAEQTARIVTVSPQRPVGALTFHDEETARRNLQREVRSVAGGAQGIEAVAHGEPAADSDRKAAPEHDVPAARPERDGPAPSAPIDLKLRAATEAANWFLSTAHLLELVLNGRHFGELPSDLAEGFCSTLRMLQAELYPNGTIGPGPRESAIKGIAPRLDIYGPVCFGPLHASNAHSAAAHWARDVFSIIGGAAAALELTRNPVCPAEDLTGEGFRKIIAWYSERLCLAADPAVAARDAEWAALLRSRPNHAEISAAIACEHAKAAAAGDCKGAPTYDGPPTPPRQGETARPALTSSDFTLQVLIDFFAVHGDGPELKMDQAFLHYLQQQQLPRYQALFRLLPWPADDPLLTTIRIVLRERFGGYNAQALAAARDAVSRNRRLPFSDCNALKLDDFLNALTATHGPTPSEVRPATAASGGTGGSPRPPIVPPSATATTQGRPPSPAQGEVATADNPTSAATSAEADVDQNAEARFRFERDGAVWRIQFEDECGSISDNDFTGLKYVARLLTRPHEAVGADQLSPVAERPPNTAKADRAFDGAGAAAVSREERRLTNAIEEALACHAHAKAEELGAELQRLKESHNKDKTKRGKAKRLGQTPLEKAAERVRKAISALKAELRKRALPKLAAHLDRIVKETTSFTYRPEKPELTWRTSL
jgi:hypothetical protein